MPRLAERLRPLKQDPTAAAVLCDIDRTLAPIVKRPEDARVPERVSRLLGVLAKRYACVACASGRRATDARRVVGERGIVYAGLHGAEILAPDEQRARVLPEVEVEARRVRRFVVASDTDRLRRLQVRIADKGPIAAFHWRSAPDQDPEMAELHQVASEASSAGLSTHWGRKVLETDLRYPLTRAWPCATSCPRCGPLCTEAMTPRISTRSTRSTSSWQPIDSTVPFA